MDVTTETDVKDVEQKCKKVNCVAIYDAIMASLKLLIASKTFLPRPVTARVCEMFLQPCDSG